MCGLLREVLVVDQSLASDRLKELLLLQTLNQVGELVSHRLILAVLLKERFTKLEAIKAINLMSY